MVVSKKKKKKKRLYQIKYERDDSNLPIFYKVAIRNEIERVRYHSPSIVLVDKVVGLRDLYL